MLKYIGLERQWEFEDEGWGEGEEWQDNSSYAAEGQLLIVEWMTNRLSVAKK